ncbi:methionyl tRS [Acrasis kona]|uniref:methionine--tRNA ligase n=1 Tax=Acrasis kona TaxID=1008807 RepID=A0AAW2YMQ7_9EUKA
MKNGRSPVTFSTGTDEHGAKVDQSAQLAGVSTLEFCNNISKTFKDAFDAFDIQYTDYIRTTEPRHVQVVEKVWSKLRQSGDLYEGSYEGWYCTSDESFILPDQVIKDEDGTVRSPTSGHKCEWLSEKTFRFKLSKYKHKLLAYYESNPKVIIPEERYNEAVIMLRNMCNNPDPNLELDLSVSRRRDRVRWGIPAPDDPSQTIYVWLDALCNYLTVSKTFTSDVEWTWTAPTVQVLGKDILKFHSIYWPALLMALGLELPKQLLVHSHWLVDGVKMSKSLGNVLDPYQAKTLVKDTLSVSDEVASRYFKYFLLRNANISQDSDFMIKQLNMRINELADNIGNLLTRVFSIKVHPNPSPLHFNHLEDLNQEEKDGCKDLIGQINSLRTDYAFHVEQNGDFRSAIECVVRVAFRCNHLVNMMQPWLLVKDENQHRKLEMLKFMVYESLRVCGVALRPVLPFESEKLLKHLNVDESTWSFDKIGFGSNGYDAPVVQNQSPILFEKSKVVNKNKSFSG